MSDSSSNRVHRRRFLAGGAGLLSLLGLTNESLGPLREIQMNNSPQDRDFADSSMKAENHRQLSGPIGESVLVNQVGYRPKDQKIAVIRSDTSSFELIDMQTGSTVYSGALSNAVSDISSGDTVRWADFSAVTEPGRYRVVTDDGTASSVEFRISSTVWEQTLQNLCRQYTLRRSNTALTDSRTGLKMDSGHPQDREAKLYFSDPFHAVGETRDVSGGWYDAGDYGKYVPTAAVTVGQLLLAYELSPELISSVDFAFPSNLLPKDQFRDLPDLLHESKFELEWLERMQRPDGAVYHKVAGTEWPGTVPPAADTQQRYVFGLSTFGTGLYAGVMAMAGRIYEPFLPDFAARMRQNARSAFEFLQSHNAPVFRHDDGQDSGSGAYRKDTDREERFWAAAELLRTTGDASYEAYINSRCTDQLTARPTPIDWNNARLFGQWAYYAADDADSSHQRTVRERLLSRADTIAHEIAQDGYRVSLRPNEYVWGSVKQAVSKGNLLLLANEIESRQRYTDGALAQIHYALGRTPTGRSYVTGAGEYDPEHPHCRLTNSLDVTIPGHVVAGPNRHGDDPVLAQYLNDANPPPGKCYVDDSESYASNEPAIDYIAPLILAIATG